MGAGAKSDGNDGATAGKNDTYFHKERERTQELRRSSKRNKNMKIDKLGEQ